MTSIWNPGSGNNIPIVDSDNSYKTQRYLVAIDYQTNFVLTDFAYVMGTNSLDVIINGVTQTPVRDFIETTGTSFQLIGKGARINDEIYVRGLIGSEGSQSAAISAAEAAESAAQALAAALTVIGINNTFISTSVTAAAISNGNKVFNVGAGKQFQIGQYVMFTSQVSPNNYMVGRVTAYDPVTGVMNASVNKYSGAGTWSSWYVSMTGEPQPISVDPNIFTNPTLLAQTYATTLALL